jgi:hypothetical protein
MSKLLGAVTPVLGEPNDPSPHEAASLWGAIPTAKRMLLPGGG